MIQPEKRDVTNVYIKRPLDLKKEELMRKRALLLSAQKQQGTLTNLGGKPSTDKRSQSERNKDYLTNPLNLERLKQSTEQLGQMARPIVGSAAIASGAYEVPATAGIIARGLTTLGKGALQGLGFGALGMGTGSVVGDISAGMTGEVALGASVQKAISVIKNMFKGNTYTGYHASYEPLTKFKESFPDNYFAKHGGTDKAIFFTDKVPESQSHLSKRPHLSKYKIKMKNPKILDFNTPTEGGTSRWADAINTAEKEGHDGVVIKGIRDNQMDNSTIYVSLNPKNIKHKKFIKGESSSYMNKSAIENNGMFDMTNPNIYKVLAGISVGGLSSRNKYQRGGKLITKYL